VLNVTLSNNLLTFYQSWSWLQIKS